MKNESNFLDRNEFNFQPSEEVVEALKNFDVKKLCFYTRIYDAVSYTHLTLPTNSLV